MSDPPSGPASPPAFKGNDRPFRLALRVFGVLLLLFGIAVTRRLFGIPLAVAPSPGSYALSFLIERSEEHTSELQSRLHLVCRLLLEKKKKTIKIDSVLTRHYLCYL